MKKQLLLTLATAGAVIVTSALSFAAWDQTSTVSNGTVTVGTPITVSSDALSFVGKLTPMAPIASDYNVNVVDEDTTGKKLSFQVSNLKADGTAITNDDITIIVKEGENTITEDTAITKGKNAYKIEVAMKDDGSDSAKAYAGKSITFDITASLTSAN